jgi:hypothetical protein
MMTTLNDSFDVASWDETSYDHRDGLRLTKASVRQARRDAMVVPGSGRGDLRELSDHGRFEAPLVSTARFSLDVDLADEPR